MTINKKVATVVSAFAIATTLGLAKPIKAAESINPNGWPIPNIEDAKFLGKKHKDIIYEIPGKETLLKGYKSPDGTYFNTLEYQGRLYGFYVDTDGKGPAEYTLLDLDGDEVFRYKSSNEPSAPNPPYIMEMANLGKD